MLHMYLNVTGINKIILRDFFKGSSLRFFSMIVHTGVWIILCHTIFLPDFIMSQMHFCSLCLLTGLPRTGLSLHLCIFSLVPNSFTLAAAEAANKDGDDDDASQHRHGDDQNLEVYPTQPPSCIIQWTHTAGGQDVPHWVVHALFGWCAPQTCHVLQAVSTSGVGSQGTRSRSWRGSRCLRLCGYTNTVESQRKNKD